jgi:hypothetical protein
MKMTLRMPIGALKLTGQSNAQIGRTLGVSERTVRYHLRRQDRKDGRKGRSRKLDPFAPVIDEWVRAQYALADVGGTDGPVPLRDLLDSLRREHGYDGSHCTLARYVRRAYPRLRLRPGLHGDGAAGADPRPDRFGPAWVLRLLLGKVSFSSLRGLVGPAPDLELL